MTIVCAQCDRWASDDVMKYQMITADGPFVNLGIGTSAMELELEMEMELELILQTPLFPVP